MTDDDDVLEITEPDDSEVVAVPTKTLDKPTVSRIIHYVAFGTPGGEYQAGAHRAAVITEVSTTEDGKKLGHVNLCIFNPTGLHFREFVPFDGDQKKPGTWHWPERD